LSAGLTRKNVNVPVGTLTSPGWYANAYISSRIDPIGADWDSTVVAVTPVATPAADGIGDGDGDAVLDGATAVVVTGPGGGVVAGAVAHATRIKGSATTTIRRARGTFISAYDFYNSCLLLS